MAANCCLRQSCGHDPKRIRFLYLSTVEPILTYACSVWLSFLNSKAGVKKLRSFERSVARLITLSFRSAPTDSLLILSNLVPLDLRILQIATTRFLSLQGLDFSPRSKAVISRRFSHLCSLPHISTPHLPVLASLPPWSLYVPPARTLPDGIPLLPSEPDSLFLYLSATCLKQVANVCVVATDISGIIRFSNASLSRPTSQRFASSLAARVAFDIILSLSARYKSFSIFAPSKSFLSLHPLTCAFFSLKSKTFPRWLA